MVGLLDKDFKVAMIKMPQQVTEAHWKQMGGGEGVGSLSSEEIIQKKQKLRMKGPMAGAWEMAHWVEPFPH